MIRWLGILLGVLSLVVLIRHGFDVGFSATLQLIVGYYEALMHLLFGWCEPIIRSTLNYLESRFGWKLELYSHWKHVFVVMWLYFGADARIAWRDGNRVASLFRGVWGGLAALFAGVASGIVQLNDPFWSVFFAVFPLVGMVVYETGRNVWNASFVRVAGLTWAQHVVRYGLHTIVTVLIGSALIVVGTQLGEIPVLKTVPSPGFVVVALGALTTAFYRAWLGWVETRRLRSEDAGSLHTYWNAGSTRISLLMFSTIGGAAGFILANAGLRLLGL